MQALCGDRLGLFCRIVRTNRAGWIAILLISVFIHSRVYAGCEVTHGSDHPYCTALAELKSQSSCKDLEKIPQSRAKKRFQSALCHAISLTLSGKSCINYDFWEFDGICQMIQSGYKFNSCDLSHKFDANNRDSDETGSVNILSETDSQSGFGTKRVTKGSLDDSDNQGSRLTYNLPDETTLFTAKTHFSTIRGSRQSLNKESNKSNSVSQEFLNSNELCNFGIYLKKMNVALHRLSPEACIMSHDSFQELIDFNSEMDDMVAQINFDESTNQDEPTKNTLKIAGQVIPQLEREFSRLGDHLSEVEKKSVLNSLYGVVSRIENNKTKWMNELEKKRRPFIEVDFELTVDQQTRVPVRVWITQSHGISIDFPTLRVGEGSFKIANLGIAYDRLAENRSDLLTVNARLQVEHVSENSLAELEHEIKVQNEMAKGSRIVKISHLLGDSSQPDLIRLQSDYYDHGTLKSFRKSLKNKSPSVAPILSRTSFPQLKKELSIQVLEQLAHIHSKEVCHRDIKPDNILVRTLDNGGVEAAITDFGLAQEVATDQGKKVFNYSGTPGYASPETFRAWNAVGRSAKPMRVPDQMRYPNYCLGTDVWATGLTLYSFTENQKLQCNPYQLDQVATYDDLCARCQAFCEPGSKEKTRVPDSNTFESVVYKMIDPNPTTRITAKKALQLMKEQLK